MIPPSVSFATYTYLPTRGRGTKPERVEDVVRPRRGRDEMSRAFVKEPDEGAPDEGLPERQISDHPNYVTPAGLRQLEQKLGELEERRLELLAAAEDDDALARGQLDYIDRDLRYFTRRFETALLVEPRLTPRLHEERGLEAPGEVAQVAVDVVELAPRQRVVVLRGGEQLEAPLFELAELLLELPQAGGGHVVGVVADLPLGEALIGRPLIGLLDECSAHLVPERTPAATVHARRLVAPSLSGPGRTRPRVTFGPRSGRRRRGVPASRVMVMRAGFWPPRKWCGGTVVRRHHST